MFELATPGLESPNWTSLYEAAAAQEGLFTTQQAAAAGYSPQLLTHHVRAGRFTHLRRGIYRLVHFPRGEHEELALAWLWSEQAGVISHQTALALHGLSDGMSASVHLTLPSAWRRRRFRVPDGIVLHHADVEANDRAWFGPVPITNPRRSLEDAARVGLSPELLVQATRQALARGLVARDELAIVEAALAPFGGIEP